MKSFRADEIPDHCVTVRWIRTSGRKCLVDDCASNNKELAMLIVELQKFSFKKTSTSADATDDSCSGLFLRLQMIGHSETVKTLITKN